MPSVPAARSLADEFDALARARSGRSATAARRRANELRLEALLLRQPEAKRSTSAPATDPDDGCG